MSACTLRINPALLLAAAGLAANPATADDKFFVGESGSGWNNNAHWNPAGIPTADDNAYIRGGRTALLGAQDAFAYQLQLGGNFDGTLDHWGRTLTIGYYTEVGGDTAGGVGRYDLYNDARLNTYRMMVGRHAVSTFAIAGTAALDSTNDIYIGGNVRGNFNQTGGTVRGHRDLFLGFNGGGDGRWTQSGGTAAFDRDVYIGYHANGSGRMQLDAGSTFRVGGTMHVGQFGATPALHGEVVVNGATLQRSAPGARVVVHGSKGRLVGQGTYDIVVQYQSDRLFANNESLRVTFDPGVMNRGAVMNVAPGLSSLSGATAEIRTALANRSLPNTSATVRWGDGSSAQSVDHRNVLGDPAGSFPMAISMPYRAADISNAFNDNRAGGAVSRENLNNRIRILQNGQRRFAPGSGTPIVNHEHQVRNVTQSIGADRVVGRVQDVKHEFDTTIIANPVKPQHQNPQFRTLHDRGLTGKNVRIGQIEPGTPNVDHGAFENWSTPNGKRLTVINNAGTTNAAHASRVASIMVGFDPFGIPVNGQSHIEPAGRRYGAAAGDGFGFVGVAPLATLTSRAQDDDPAGTDDDRMVNNLRRLVITDNSKIVNMSATILANTVIEGQSGNRKGELAIDYFVQHNGLVMVSAAANIGARGYQTLGTGAAAYNSIVVANAEFNDPNYPTEFNHVAARVANTSSRGATSDGRAKPDITAHGRGVLSAFRMETTTTLPNGNVIVIPDPSFPVEGDRGMYSTQERRGPNATVPASGTSYAAPQVAGLAALMVEQAAISFNGADRDRATSPLTIKSVLQTSADKPPSWQRGKAGDAGDAANTGIPLSYDWGAGLVSPVGAIDLFQRGNFGHGEANPIFGQGWAQATIAENDNDDIGGQNGHIYLLKDVKANSAFTATLNWFREMQAPAVGAPDQNNYTLRQFFDLNLELFSWDGANFNQIAISNSTIDNVEHLWLTMPNVNSDYYLRVFHNRMPAGRSTPYALSWTYTLVPAPGSLLALLGLFAFRRRRSL